MKFIHDEWTTFICVLVGVSESQRTNRPGVVTGTITEYSGKFDVS
jgi:hypothetical protein